MLKKKYTMEEFERKFIEAQKKSVEKLRGHMHEAIIQSGKDGDEMYEMLDEMKNMIAYAVLHKYLFGDEDDE